MPIYEYRCDDGHTFEVIQSMSDDPVAVCESCGKPVQRVFHPIAVHFKGSGFYTTDYGRKKSGAAAGASSEGQPESKSDGSGSSSGGESKPDKKEPAKASSSESKS